jgi:low affinity Fe/Cu permease
MSATPAPDSGRPPQSVRAQPRQSDPDWKAWFSRFAHETAQLAGKPGTFLLAVAVVVVWAVSGPFFGFNDTRQLVINTGTTILTFLMVFLIQNTQNRDTLALQLKLTELVLTMKGARDRFATIEDCPTRSWKSCTTSAAGTPIGSPARWRGDGSRGRIDQPTGRAGSNAPRMSGGVGEYSYPPNRTATKIRHPAASRIAS